MPCDNCGNCKPKAVAFKHGKFLDYCVEYKGKVYPFGSSELSKQMRDRVLDRALTEPDYILDYGYLEPDEIYGEKTDD